MELEDRSGVIVKELGKSGSFRAKMAFASGHAQQAQARQGAELQEVTTEVRTVSILSRLDLGAC